MSENPWGITREEVLEAAARRLADEYSDIEKVGALVESMVRKATSEAIQSQLTSKLDHILTKTTETLLTAEIQPVDIWGDRTGPATTIKAALIDKSREFWTAKVNHEGKPVDRYGNGRPRCEWLLQKLVNDEFMKIAKQEMTNIAGAFKDALKVESLKAVSEHIDKIIQVKTA